MPKISESAGDHILPCQIEGKGQISRTPLPHIASPRIPVHLLLVLLNLLVFLAVLLLQAELFLVPRPRGHLLGRRVGVFLVLPPGGLPPGTGVDGAVVLDVGVGGLLNNGDIFVEFIAAVVHDEFLVLVAEILLDGRGWFVLGVTIGVDAGHRTDSALVLLIRPAFAELAFAKGVVVVDGGIPPPLLLGLLLHVHRLGLPVELLPGLVLVLDGLVDPGVAAGPLNVDGVETAHVGLVVGDPVLEGELLGALEDVLFGHLGVVEFAGVVLAGVLRQEVLPRWHLRRVGSGLPVVPCSVRHKILLVEWVCVVEIQLVKVHQFYYCFKANPSPSLAPAEIPGFCLQCNIRDNILLMAELNGSSYYRANPFYQQGYLPDQAYKNRKVPSHMVEIPQGQEHFEPTNKKHFQRLGYYTTIGQEHIMDPDSDPQPSPSRDRQYFRNLHIEDIEGANTNTLISKAVKNKLKAKEYLAQRQRAAKEEQMRQKVRKVQRKEEEQRRLQALSKMRKQPEPNYHEKVMKLKTEQSQGKYSPQHHHKQQQKSHEQRYRQPQESSNHHQYHQGTFRNKSQAPPPSNFHERQYEEYRRQLQKTQREIRQLEDQLRESRQYQKSKEKGLSYHSPHPQEPPYQQKHEDIQKHIMPQTYQHPSPQSHYNQYDIDTRRASVPHHDTSGRDDHKEPRPSLPRNLNSRELGQHRNYSGPIANHEKLRSLTTHHQPIQPQGQPPSPPRNIESPIYDQRGEAKQTKQEHRRLNPTYLSYGSAAIGRAGRNIVGF